MSNDELLDLVNQNDEVIGTVWKSEAHADPSKIHREAGVLVFTKDKQFLMSRRSLQKTSGAGDWEIGPSGHIEANEAPIIAAARELKEEVGLEGNIKFCYKFFDKHEKESRFFYIYYLELDKVVPVNYQKEEIEETKWIQYKDLHQFVKTHPSKAMDESYKVVKYVLANLKSE